MRYFAFFLLKTKKNKKFFNETRVCNHSNDNLSQLDIRQKKKMT